MSPTLSRGITHANVLMTLLIVCMHAIWIDETRLLPLFVLTNAAVPTFFVISSLLYFQHWQPTWACYRQKLLSRVRSLLVPYLLYNVLFYGYYVVKIHVLHMSTTKVIPTDLGGVLLCILQSVPDGVLWYVRDLFLFALIAPLIGLVLRKSRILSAVLTAASLGCFLLPFFGAHLFAAGRSEDRSASLDDVGDALFVHIEDLLMEKPRISSFDSLDFQPVHKGLSADCTDRRVHAGGIASARQDPDRLD